MTDSPDRLAEPEPTPEPAESAAAATTEPAEAAQPPSPEPADAIAEPAEKPAELPAASAPAALPAAEKPAKARPDAAPWPPPPRLGARRRGQLGAAVLGAGFFAIVTMLVAVSTRHHGVGPGAGLNGMFALMVAVQTITVALWFRWRGALLGEGKRGLGALSLLAMLPLLIGVVRGYTEHRPLGRALEETTTARLLFRVALEGASECVVPSAVGAMASGLMMLLLAALGLVALRTLPEAREGESSPWLGPSIGAWCMLLVVGLLHTKTTVDFGPVDRLVLLAVVVALVASCRLLRRRQKLEKLLGEGWASRLSPALSAAMLGLVLGVPLLAWGEAQLIGSHAAEIASRLVENGFDRDLAERIDRARELRPLVALADALLAVALWPLALGPELLSASFAAARKAARPALLPLGIAALAIAPEQLMTRRVVGDAASFFARFDGDPDLDLPTLPRFDSDPPRGPAVLLRRKGDILWDDTHGLAPPQLFAEDHPGRYIKAWERSQDLDVVPITLDLLVAGDVLVPFGNVRAVTRLLERSGQPWRYHLLAWTSAKHRAFGPLASKVARAQLGAAFPFDVWPRDRFYGALERESGWVVKRAGAAGPGGDRSPLEGAPAGVDLAIEASDRATLGDIAGAWQAALAEGLRPRRVVVVAEDDARGELLSSR